MLQCMINILFLVFATYADLHWQISNKNLNEDLFDGNVLSSTPLKHQKRNTVKNAKLVFSLRQISTKDIGQHLSLFRLQHKIVTKNKTEDLEWIPIRTFRLPKYGKVQYIVIGVKSLVRKYLMVRIQLYKV